MRGDPHPLGHHSRVEQSVECEKQKRQSDGKGDESTRSMGVAYCDSGETNGNEERVTCGFCQASVEDDLDREQQVWRTKRLRKIPNLCGRVLDNHKSKQRNTGQPDCPPDPVNHRQTFDECPDAHGWSGERLDQPYILWSASATISNENVAMIRNLALMNLVSLRGGAGSRGGGVRGAAGEANHHAPGAAALLPPNERSRTLCPPHAPASAITVAPLAVRNAGEPPRPARLRARRPCPSAMPRL